MRRVSMDGSVLNIAGLVDEELLVSEYAWYTDPPQWNFGIQVTRPHVAELMLTDVMAGDVTGSEEHNGGVLFVGHAGSGGQHDGTLVGWRGQSFSIYSVVPHGLLDLATAARMYGRLTLRETPEGVVLFDRSKRKSLQRRQMILSYRNGAVSILVKEISPDSLTAVPPGKGAEVRGGELWQGEYADEHSFVHLGKTAVTLISSPDAEAALRCAEGLQIDWVER